MLNNRWREAKPLARECPNVDLELTSILGPRGTVEGRCAGAGCERRLYGTDLLWFEEHPGIGSLPATELSDDDIHNVLHRNAERRLSGRR